MVFVKEVGNEIWILMHGPLGFVIGLGGLYFVARNALINFLEMAGIEQFRANSEVLNRLPNEKMKFEEIHNKIRNLTIALLLIFIAAVVLYLSVYSGIDTNAVVSRKATLDEAESAITLSIFVLAIAAVVVESLIARQKLRRNMMLTAMKS